MLTTLSVILIRCRTLLTHVFPIISPYDLFVRFDQVLLAYLLPMRGFFFFFSLNNHQHVLYKPFICHPWKSSVNSARLSMRIYLYILVHWSHMLHHDLEPLTILLFWPYFHKDHLGFALSTLKRDLEHLATFIAHHLNFDIICWGDNT